MTSSDPSSHAVPDDLKDALDLWRDDVGRRAAKVDPDALHAAVLARAERGADGASSDSALRRYAVAAVVLIGLGTVGSTVLAVVPTPAGAEPPSLRSIDEQRTALQAAGEILSLPVVQGPAPSAAPHSR